MPLKSTGKVSLVGLKLAGCCGTTVNGGSSTTRTMSVLKWFTSSTSSNSHTCQIEALFTRWSTADASQASQLASSFHQGENSRRPQLGVCGNRAWREEQRMRLIRLISREIDRVRLTPTEVADRVVDELLAVFRLGDVGRRDEDAWRAERHRPVADFAEAHLPPRHQRQVGLSFF